MFNSLKCKILLRFDDIAPNMKWEMMSRVKNLLEKYDVKPIIGVIPKNEDNELKAYPKCSFNFWNEIKNLQINGWEIAMHGYQHLYEAKCEEDYLGHGGNTEFSGFSYENQLKKLTLGLEIFKKQNIEIKTFFAPNHTFDKNTIKACKAVGIDTIVDGYGLAPYYENGVFFLPQLFYRLLALPFGFQTLQIHLNYFDEKNFVKLEKFIKKNQKKIISFSNLDKPIKNSFFDKVIKYIIEKILKFIRKTRERSTSHKHHN